MAALALAYGGIAQFAAGLWEFRTGNTFGAVAFCSFGAFWISFYFLRARRRTALPKTEVFSAVGLYLWAWGIFTAYMFIASLRTTGAVALVFLLLAITFIVLGIGNSALAGTQATNGTIKLGGYVGLVTAIAAWYASFAGVLNATRSAGRCCRSSRSTGDGRPRAASRSGVQLDADSRASAASPGAGGDPPAPALTWVRETHEFVTKERLAMADTAAAGEGDPRAAARGDARDRDASIRPRRSREHALLSDPAIYEEADADWKGWWVKQAKELHWFKEPTEDLDDSNPPFYKWFEDGKLNASYNCLDRHVEAGNGDRVAFHWRGEEGEERDVTYADLHRDVQRFANALKDLGIEKGDVVGIYLPMIPEVVVAMLACARIGAPHNVVFGGFSADSVRERMEFSEAKALITVDGARRKGKTAPIKQQVDAVMGDLETLEHIVVVKSTGADVRDAGGSRRLVPRDLRRRPTRSARPSSSTPSTRCSSSTPAARPPSRRASCTRPAAT